MTPARPDRGHWGVCAVWLVAAIVLTAINWSRIVGGLTADGDDYMRLLEVRDWLSGQTWWDVSQHRLNPPVGGLMHWSRLVDLPIAFFLAPLTPLLGTRAAEAVTVTVVPLATLGILMLVVAGVVRRLFPSVAAPAIAALLIATTGYVTVQTFPTRIDHHGWQIVCAAAALAALLDPRPLRSGSVAGLAMALWLNISIEGLPFAVAAAGAVALRWLIAPAEEGRRFAATMAALAGGSALFFLATHAPSAWSLRWCDAVTPAHILVFAAAAAGSALLVRAASGCSVPVRLGLLAVLGAACAAGFLSIAPGCAANPFGRLDPLVHDLWYLNVPEGLPVWRQSPVVAINLVFFPLVGLIGCTLAWRGASSPAARRDWLTVAILLLASLALGLLLRRATGVAHVMAVPGALAIIEPLRVRVARFASPVARSFGLFAAVCIPSPLTPIYASALLPAPPPGPPAGLADCDTRCSLAAVAALPPAEILATFDIGPPVLALTHHSVLAAGYHRNDRPMADLIRAFMAGDDNAHAIVRRHDIGYVLIQPQSSEAQLYAGGAPAGLMAGLRRGRAPAWLEPVALGRSEFRLWRVIS